MKLSATYLKKQQEWLEEGRQGGIVEGEQRGAQRTRQANAIAALCEGISPEVVAKITELSLEEIEKPRENLSGR